MVPKPISRSMGKAKVQNMAPGLRTYSRHSMTNCPTIK
jgi:hypothetical protein